MTPVKWRAGTTSHGAPPRSRAERWCGRALALSHARAGCAAPLSGYMGGSDALDKAIASFSLAYADQNERDHGALARAVRGAKVKAVFEETK